MESDVYWDWLNRLEIDQRPDTDLLGAVAGQVKSKQQFVNHPIEPATTAFGQGFALTPLKLVQLHALLANGGRLVSPRITRGFRSGDALAPAALPSGRQLVRPEVAETVLSCPRLFSACCPSKLFVWNLRCTDGISNVPVEYGTN